MIKSSCNIILYKDKSIPYLRKELDSLEKKLEQLQNIKDNISKKIRDFEVEYNQRLGDLIKELFILRQERIDRIINEKKESPDQNDENNEYYKSSYEKNINKEKQKKIILSETEEKEIKKKYRKAVSLCHPDVLDERLKKQGEEIFNELVSAYNENDIHKIDKILNQLISGNYFVDKEKLNNNCELLKKEINKIKNDLNLVNREIENLKSDKKYQFLLRVKDLDLFLQNEELKIRREIDSILIRFAIGEPETLSF